ncbi:enoyl-CoA hydratase-related protein [Tsuneonella sp. HG222]
MSEHVTATIGGGVLEIAFARPDKKNALNSAMYEAICQAMDAARDDAAVRAILFHGEGDSFTAGNDLADFAKVASGGSEGLAAAAFIDRLIAAEKPIVVAVQGQAVGIGTTMLLHADLVFVAEDARLATPFVNLALVPEAVSSRLLPQRIGHARAFAMFALGESLSGAEAATLGLANRALPAAEVLAAARAAAAALAQRPPGAVQAAKRLMRDGPALSAQNRAELAVFRERLQSAEAAEAFTAFMERRPPDFTKF